MFSIRSVIKITCVSFYVIGNVIGNILDGDTTSLHRSVS
jgi:hypothetical protein